MKCAKCGAQVSENLQFCTECGAKVDEPSLGAKARQDGFELVAQTERFVYFRIARGFAWFLLFLVTLGMLCSLFFVIPALGRLFGASTRVTSKDLERAIANARQETDQEQSDIHPAELAKLDEAAYEIVSLLPQDSRRYESVDALRDEMKSMAATASPRYKEQLEMLRELGKVLPDIGPARRADAVSKYFRLKSQKIEENEAQRAAAKASLILTGWGLLSGTALLTLITMILVLLAIERNTRAVVS